MGEKIMFNFDGAAYEVADEELYCGLTAKLGLRNCLKFTQAEGHKNLTELKLEAENRYPSRSALDMDLVHMKRSEFRAVPILRFARKLQKKRDSRVQQ